MKIKDRNITQWNNLKVNYWGITKCANSTIKTHLWELENKQQYVSTKDISIHGVDNLVRLTSKEALQSSNINFTVVRNPYSRFTSQYRDLVLSRKKVGRRAHIEDMTINQVLDFLITTCDNQRDVHLKSQCAFVNHNTVKVIHLENLDKEWFFDFPPPSFKKNITPNQEKIVLTKEQKDCIYRIYENDFLRFGYLK